MHNYGRWIFTRGNASYPYRDASRSVKKTMLSEDRSPQTSAGKKSLLVRAWNPRPSFPSLVCLCVKMISDICHSLAHPIGCLVVYMNNWGLWIVSPYLELEDFRRFADDLLNWRIGCMHLPGTELDFQPWIVLKLLLLPWIWIEQPRSQSLIAIS